MKLCLFISIFLFISTCARCQLYDRRTNNNVVYSDSSARIEIERIYESIKAGSNFSQLAERYSQDPGTYKDGGNLKPGSMDGYVDEYRAVVLKLKPGEISHPFKTDFGYHIVQLISKVGNVFATRHILIRVD